MEEKKVRTGAKVKILLAGEEKVFTILTTKEADPLNGIISNLSPLGSSLIGAIEGEERSYEAGGKTFKVKVLKILDYVF
ncbi:GreA/GreB family elongation factor [Candidatus Parcubacteria bacterium]|nr:MAG: GreA/GreB family elongation factor [Candidatus Parcubacteria bacterium]